MKKKIKKELIVNVSKCCKRFKRVANIQNTFIILKTRFKCCKRVANISNTLLIFKTRL